jgi:hypothetical protein
MNEMAKFLFMPTKGGRQGEISIRFEKELFKRQCFCGFIEFSRDAER